MEANELWALGLAMLTKVTLALMSLAFGWMGYRLFMSDKLKGGAEFEVGAGSRGKETNGGGTTPVDATPPESNPLPSMRVGKGGPGLVFAAFGMVMFSVITNRDLEYHREDSEGQCDDIKEPPPAKAVAPSRPVDAPSNVNPSPDAEIAPGTPEVSGTATPRSELPPTSDGVGVDKTAPKVGDKATSTPSAQPPASSERDSGGATSESRKPATRGRSKTDMRLGHTDIPCRTDADCSYELTCVGEDAFGMGTCTRVKS